MTVLKPMAPISEPLQRVLDAAVISASLFTSSQLLDREWSYLQTVVCIAAIAVFLVIGQGARLYSSSRLRSADDEFKTAFVAWAATCVTLIVIAFLSKVSSNYSRIESVVWFLITPFFLIYSRIAMRLLLRWMRSAGGNTRSVAIAGATPVAESIVGQLEELADFGVRLHGIYDDRLTSRAEGNPSLPLRRAGSLDQMVEQARQGTLDYVLIALPMRAEKRIVDLTNRLADTTASVYVIPDLFIFDLMRARWTSLGALPMVGVYESPFDGLSGIVKRLEDVMLGALFLLLAAVPMLIIAIALKVTSKETVLFRQQRYGLNGRVVRVIKFRTMNVSEDGGNVIQAQRNDPRITPIGRFLRRTSLDELPQLLNVLVGDMSLVGPRPHAVKVNEDFRRLVHGYMLRHKVKPGITGWAQVNGWHGEDTLETMQKRVNHDLAYLENWSLWFDLKILFVTIAALFQRKTQRAS
jgi:putative colanic acid biosysnthesis UDP-glucose lipid carrier transferase